MHNVHGRETRLGHINLQLSIHGTIIYDDYFHVQSIRLIKFVNEDMRGALSKRVYKTKCKSKLLSSYEIY